MSNIRTECLKLFCRCSAAMEGPGVGDVLRCVGYEQPRDGEGGESRKAGHPFLDPLVVARWGVGGSLQI